MAQKHIFYTDTPRPDRPVKVPPFREELVIDKREFLDYLDRIEAEFHEAAGPDLTNVTIDLKALFYDIREAVNGY